MCTWQGIASEVGLNHGSFFIEPQLNYQREDAWASHTPATLRAPPEVLALFLDCSKLPFVSFLRIRIEFSPSTVRRIWKRVAVDAAFGSPSAVCLIPRLIFFYYLRTSLP